MNPGLKPFWGRILPFPTLGHKEQGYVLSRTKMKALLPTPAGHAMFLID